MKQANGAWKTVCSTVLSLGLAGAIALTQGGAIALADATPDPAPTVIFPMPSAITNDTRVRLGGTPVMAPINQALKQEFEDQFPGTAVEVELGGDTETVLEALKSGALDLAGIGRSLTEAEKAQGLREVPVSLDQIAIVVGRNNPFQGSLTMPQLAQIFDGTLTDWAELGGAPGPIRLVDRPATSETRLALQRYGIIPPAGLPDTLPTTTLAEDDTAELVKQLGRDGLGYAIANQVRQNPKVRPVKIAVLQTTLPGDTLYPYSQVRGYVYKDENNPAIRAFLGFTATDAGRDALAAARREEAKQVAVAIAPPEPPAAPPEAPQPIATTPAFELPSFPQLPLWLWILAPLTLLGVFLGVRQQQRRRARRAAIKPVTVRRKPRTPEPTPQDAAISETLEAWLEDTPPESTPEVAPEIAPETAPEIVEEAVTEAAAEASVNVVEVEPSETSAQPSPAAETVERVEDEFDAIFADETSDETSPANGFAEGLGIAPATAPQESAEILEEGWTETPVEVPDGAIADEFDTFFANKAADESADEEIGTEARLAEGLETAPDTTAQEEDPAAAPPADSLAEPPADSLEEEPEDGDTHAVEGVVEDAEVSAVEAAVEVVEQVPDVSEEAPATAILDEAPALDWVAPSEEPAPDLPEAAVAEALNALLAESALTSELPPTDPSAPSQTTEIPSEDVTPEEPSAQESSGEEISAEEISAEELSTPESSVEEPSVEKTFVEEISVDESSAQAPSAEASPGDEILAEASENYPADENPTEDISEPAAWEVYKGILASELGIDFGEADLAALRRGQAPAETQRHLLQRLVTESLAQSGKTPETATPQEVYRILAMGLCHALLMGTTRTFSAAEGTSRLIVELATEYTPGKHLRYALVTQHLLETAQTALADLGLDLEAVLAAEPEPGLGLGPVGRLMVCSLEALATQDIPALGYGLYYGAGDFEQAIEQGWQVERPIPPSAAEDPWVVAHPCLLQDVYFGGYTESWVDHTGRFRVRWVPQEIVRGDRYDVPIPGYGTERVNLLRLWRAPDAEALTQTRYPADADAVLRLRQQFFLVSCTVQDLLQQFYESRQPWVSFPDQVAIHLNGPETLLAIAELMRLLVDAVDLPWETAWDITHNTFSYTNHSLLPETLEDQWTVEAFNAVLPRHLEIIYEINARFLEDVRSQVIAEASHIQRMSLVAEDTPKRLRLSNLACLGTYSINGVSPLHTQLLQERVFPDFAALNPLLFSHQSGGVSPRRFVALANPALAALLTETLGSQWLADPACWSQLAPYAEDAAFRQAWQQVKQRAKQQLATLIEAQVGIRVDPASLFAGQLGAVQEHKRHLLNLLYVLSLYLQLRDGAAGAIAPRTVLFSGKAAPHDLTARRLIKLMHLVAAQVNGDPGLGDRLKVVFLPNFTQTLAERLYPALDLSEHLSLAGTDASDTSHLIAALNGARILGSPDGCNLELWEVIGAENGFQFGMPEPKVSALLEAGYNPSVYEAAHPALKTVIDFLASPALADHAPDAIPPLVHQLLTHDPYRILADAEPYFAAQAHISDAFQQPALWHAAAIRAWARLGDLSSDRTIHHTYQTLWNLPTFDKSLRQCIPPAPADPG